MYPCNYYENRELSWLLFNKRVLEEANNEENPLFERLKFLSITSSNLDEFYRIRVASINKLIKEGQPGDDISGKTPLEESELISLKAHEMVRAENEAYLELCKLLSGFAKVDIIRDVNSLSSEEKQEIDDFYYNELYPALTPITVDGLHKFPLIRNDFIHVGALAQKEDSDFFCYVQVPKGFGRIVRAGENRSKHILLESIVEAHFNELFSDYECSEVTSFRVLRDADFTLNDDFCDDIVSVVKEHVKKREVSSAIRLETSDDSSSPTVRFLCERLELSDTNIFTGNTVFDYRFLMELYKEEGFDRFKRPEYTPVRPWEFEEGKSLFSQLKEHDLMLIHPFDSFEPVIDFISEASRDSDVLAIKQTLYRVSGDSPIVKALINAAKNGKQVTVLVEVKARFDEENNIEWAKLLEEAGCHVIYGFASIKTHCKITLVVRKEEGGIRRYVHLGTGNYNDFTAKLYTDISFFTADGAIGEDAGNVFNMLSGLSDNVQFNRLVLSPAGLRNKIIELIDREREHAINGRPAHIVAKMNSLCDRQIIDALYDASRAGVKIELIVRGICSLKTGIAGVSDNITVRSIVGNFLEHSRVFYFKNGGDREYYCSSADWMPRNMDRRIEILFPVQRKRLCEKLYHVLKLMLKDNRKAWILDADGVYRKKPEDEELYSFQEGFFEEEIVLTENGRRGEER